jgi:uncharacterized membrane protein
MSEQNPVIDRYMASFESSLQHYDLLEWREIASDLRNHIAEALEYGKPLDAVLEGLGGADVLARAYAVELKLNPRPDSRGRAIGSVLSVLGIVSASGIVSFIIVAGLGSIALGLFGSGFGMLIIGAIEAMGIHLPGVQLAGIHPLFIVALGPVIMLVGLAAGWGVWLYVRALIDVLRKALPRAWASRQAEPLNSSG